MEFECARDTRAHLGEIKRIAEGCNGKPPGKTSFATQTGISEAQWSGVFRARWSEALAEAGYGPNTLQAKFETDVVIGKIIEACRYYQRIPTVAEFKLSRRRDPTFPSKGAIASHFPGRAALLLALGEYIIGKTDFEDIIGLLALEPSPAPDPTRKVGAKLADGFVYLIKSGDHFKIGRSEDLERRVKEIRLALPDAATLAHVISTDDPAGIEAYWHRRFAERRANGEWFSLGPSDVAAFRRRKFQ